MNTKQVSTAARLAGIAESTVMLLEHGDAALLSAADVARIAGRMGQGEAVAWRYVVEVENASPMASLLLIEKSEADDWSRRAGCTVFPVYRDCPAPASAPVPDMVTRGEYVEFGKSKYLDGLQQAIMVCDELCWAIDAGGNQYRREAPAGRVLMRLREIYAKVSAAAPTAAQSRIAELEAQLAEVKERLAVEEAHSDGYRQQLTESREREGRMRNMLTDIYDVNRDVPDAIDNDGKPYQSEYLASQLAALAAEKE